MKDVQGDESLLTVSPNPTSGKLHIQLADNHLMEACTLRDLTGKIITQFQMTNAVQQAEMDLEGMPQGMYLLQVRSDRQIISKKIILQ